MSNKNSPIPTPPKTVFGLSEKIFLASQAALISLLVAALTTLGVLTTARVNDRSVDADFTKIALSILARDFDPKKPEYTREFAVKMLAQSSGIELTEAERTAWVKDGDVIGKGWVSDQARRRCPSSYKMGHQSGLSIGGSGSVV